MWTHGIIRTHGAARHSHCTAITVSCLAQAVGVCRRAGESSGSLGGGCPGVKQQRQLAAVHGVRALADNAAGDVAGVTRDAGSRFKLHAQDTPGAASDLDTMLRTDDTQAQASAAAAMWLFVTKATTAMVAPRTVLVRCGQLVERW